MNPKEQINQLTQTTPNTTRWWVCPQCRHVEEIDMAKALPKPQCPNCAATIQRVSRPSPESAQEAIKNLENAERLAAMTPSTEAKAAPAATEPKLTATKDPVPPVAEQPAPAAEQPAPKERGKRGAKANKPVEIPATLAAAAPVEPVAPPVVEEAAPISDAAAHRAAVLAALIAKHKLTEHSWIRLGSGRVLSHGFTTWTEDEQGNRKPAYTIRDLADSGEYAQSLKAARASDGSITTDVVIVTALPTEIRAVCWNGELIASLRDGSQTHAPKVGQTVQLSAKVSRTGRLVWCVSGVA